MKTYYATLELDPRSGQWMADIERLPVHTWGRTLAKVKEYAHEALAVHLNVDVADVRGHLVFRKPQLPAPVLEAIDQAEASRSIVDTASAVATEAKATATRSGPQTGGAGFADAEHADSDSLARFYT